MQPPSWWFVLAFQLLPRATAAGNRFLGRVKYQQISNFTATRSPELAIYENLAKARWASLASEKKKKAEKISIRNSGDERPIEPGKRKCEMGGLWACQCIDGNGKLRCFHLAFFCPSKFLIGKPSPAPYRPRTQFCLKKKNFQIGWSF